MNCSINSSKGVADCWVGSGFCAGLCSGAGVSEIWGELLLAGESCAPLVWQADVAMKVIQSAVRMHCVKGFIR